MYILHIHKQSVNVAADTTTTPSDCIFSTDATDLAGGVTKTFSGGETARLLQQDFVLTFASGETRDLTQIRVTDPNLPQGVLLRYIPVKPDGSQGEAKNITTGGLINVNPASDTEAAGIGSLRIERSDGLPVTTADFTNIYVEACLERKFCHTWYCLQCTVYVNTYSICT